MSEIEFKYPYNPNNNRGDCKVVGESVNLTLANGEDYQFIIPNYAPFFEKDLVVKSITRNKTLLINVDFILTHKFRSATDYLNKDIFASITFLDKDLNGEIELSYNTLGGDFTAKDDLALVQLISSLTSHRTVDWEDITELPATYPPSPHVHTPDEIMDMNDVIIALDNIAVLLRGDEHPNHRHTMDQIDGLFDALEGKVAKNKHVVFAPTPPIVINGMGTVIALKLPTVLSETAMRIEIWITNGLLSSELSVVGLLEPNKSESNRWAGLQVRADNIVFTDIVAGAYDKDGNPILYLHSTNDPWDDVTFTIPKTTYSKITEDNISGDYSYANATTLIGNVVNIDNYIYQSQFIHLEDRLHRVKLNTLLDEIIYDVI